MTAHSLVHEEARRTSVRRAGRKGPLQLGWLHFWLLAITVGWILALAMMLFVLPMI